MWAIVNPKTGECRGVAEAYAGVGGVPVPPGCAPPVLDEGFEFRELAEHENPAPGWKYDPDTNTRVPDEDYQAVLVQEKLDAFREQRDALQTSIDMLEIQAADIAKAADAKGAALAVDAKASAVEAAPTKKR
jgi:hypothetical protein